MKFASPLIEARLIKRYKRFLADIRLDSGEVITAHCANSGSMMGLNVEGARVWISPATNPKAKLDWRWELIEIDGALVGINTMHPNRIVEEAIRERRIASLTGFDNLRREVKYGVNSRIDLLLEGEGLTYVEVKNVTLKRGSGAEFPDAVTARGSKHLKELSAMVREGHRAVMFYLVQRGDCDSFGVAADIDPTYAAGLSAASQAGVEILCYDCEVTPLGVTARAPLPIRLGIA